uniref:(northern house mosquito) hypothetical protein n=1 Tax=Culex pipiens TaxID=7175 RepID=A0A8D7ZZR1_CULPI
MMEPMNVNDYDNTVIIKLTVVQENGNSEHMLQRHGIRNLTSDSIVSKSELRFPEVRKWRDTHLYWIDDVGDHVFVDDSADLKCLARFVHTQATPKMLHFVLQRNRAQQMPAKVLFSVEKK